MLAILLVNVIMRTFDQKRSIGALKLSYGKLLARRDIVECHINRTFRTEYSNIGHRPLLIKSQTPSLSRFIKSLFKLKTHIFRTEKETKMLQKPNLILGLKKVVKHQ